MGGGSIGGKYNINLGFFKLSNELWFKFNKLSLSG